MKCEEGTQEVCSVERALRSCVAWAEEASRVGIGLRRSVAGVFWGLRRCIMWRWLRRCVVCVLR